MEEIWWGSVTMRSQGDQVITGRPAHLEVQVQDVHAVDVGDALQDLLEVRLDLRKPNGIGDVSMLS